ncbi:Bcr/CflA family efflux MFS transporter [Sphingobacterium sp. T2]|uniref:Bcr/CflA family efflux MFS transporter n=1 Tax=Sphingobacterium sp. T2 TaxID=1590596 RepID=UPI00068E70A5|nr:Bcr/CflA family efflux MFS transporter [Sphingobacterium sp. T2]
MHRQNSATFILVFAAILSAFAPLTTDLYLPALPVLTEAFATNASNVQLSLKFSFIGMATGQLLFGPLSDKQGRKTPLLMSLVAFVLATLGCIYAWNIESFNFFRLLQGFAGAGGLVISRSIAVDLYEEEHLARFLSSLAVINGIAPIIAPVGGGVLLDFTDWRGIFVVLLILGVCILMGGVYFKETLPVSRRLQGNMLKTYSSFGKVLRNRNYLNYTLSIGFTSGMFFVLLSLLAVHLSEYL